MKKILTFLFLAYAAYAAAQTDYTLTVTHGNAYTELSNGVALQYLDSPSYGYYHPEDFTFPVFGRTASFRTNLSPVSAGAYVSPGGFCAVYEAPGYSNTIVFMVLDNSNALTQLDGITKVSCKTEGSAVGSRILRFEWKDITVTVDTSARLNFQLWLDESDKSISYHYGPSTPGLAGATFYCGLIAFGASGNLVNTYNLEGDSANPHVVTAWTNMPELNGVPANGTVYKMTPVMTGVSAVNLQSTSPRLYPNPAVSHLLIDQLQEGEADIRLYDLCGALVKSYTAYPANGLNISELSNGLYLLRVNGGLGQRFVKRSE